MLGNLLNQALSLIPSQTGSIERFASRVKNARGQYVTTKAAPETISGSLQAVPRETYAEMGLELKKIYYMLFTSNDVSGLARGDSGDFLTFSGMTFQAVKEGGWKPIDGWDGIMLVKIGEAPPPPPPEFCEWMTYTPFADTWDIPAVFDSVEQTVTLEQFSGFGSAVYASNQTWKASTGTVSFESEVIEILDASIYDQVIGIGDLDQLIFIAGVYITSAGGDTIRNAIDGVPFGSITMETGYISGVKFNAGTASFVLYDNNGNEFSAPTDPLFNPDNELSFFFQFAAFNANKFVNKINTGSGAFALPQSSGIYCDQIYNP